MFLLIFCQYYSKVTTNVQYILLFVLQHKCKIKMLEMLETNKKSLMKMKSIAVQLYYQNKARYQVLDCSKFTTDQCCNSAWLNCEQSKIWLSQDMKNSFNISKLELLLLILISQQISIFLSCKDPLIKMCCADSCKLCCWLVQFVPKLTIGASKMRSNPKL